MAQKPNEPVVTTHRLNERQYKALEASLPDPFVSDKTSDLQAGFQLGVQHVLKRLREGFVL